MVQGQYKDDSRHFTDGSHLILWERSSEKQYVWLWRVKQRSICQCHLLYSGYTRQSTAHSCSPRAYNLTIKRTPNLNSVLTC